MTKYFILFVIILTSCSIFQKNYFGRKNNQESQLLNEYMNPFFEQTEPFQIKGNIYLEDVLNPVTEIFSKKLEKYSISYKDSLYSQALFDLSRTNKKEVEINFSQLKNLLQLNLHPGDIEKPNLSNWSYSLSLPGFSKDSSHICFTSFYDCGPLCACFSIIFMKKVDNKWIFDREQIIMQS